MHKYESIALKQVYYESQPSSLCSLCLQCLQPYLGIHSHRNRQISWAYPSLIITSLIMIGVLTCPPIVSYKMLAKLKKNTTKLIITTNLIIALIIALLLFLLFTQRISEAHQKIETFVIQNNKLEFHEYVTVVCSFLNNNVKNAYKSPKPISKSTSASTAYHLVNT